MLVLSRRIGESIVIDKDIRVTVVSVQGGRVEIGIEAPKDMRISRSEIRNQVPAQNPESPAGRPVDAKA